jgi:polar amino acid transport system substrate-binding protein
MNQRLRMALILSVLVVVLTTTSILFLTRESSLSRLQQAGSIRIGYAVEAPYAFLKPGGEVTGESPEVARAIVSRLGIPQIHWRLVEFTALVGELESGRIDVIAAGMFITPERAHRVSFSEPTFHVQQGLLVSEGNPWQLHSYEQVLARKDLRIAVVSGAVEERLLRQIGLLDRQLVIVPDAQAGRVAVESGLADGLALSSPTIQWMAQWEQLGKTEAALPFEQPKVAAGARLGYGAFVFRNSDRQLRTAWNKAMKLFIGSPEHLKIITEFGFSAVELPGSVTTREILSP